MTGKKRKRPRIGDIISIETSTGLAYMQYTYKDNTFGYLVRVLPGIYQEQPESLDDLVAQPEQFYVFFPLGAALYRGNVSIVAAADLPEHAQKQPPLMRMPLRDANRKVLSWWLWDGDKEWEIGALSPEQHHLSIARAVNDIRLIERIESGWQPEDEI